MEGDMPNGVTTTQVMAAPMLSDAYARRNYSVLPEPEAVHARLWGDPEKHEYHLNYNGYDIIHLSVRGPGPVRVRCYSDGNFQSTPFVQQLHVQALEEAEVEIRFTLPCDMVCMRPERAAQGRAILGQAGRPLIYGVNGLYVLDWDLLLSWHGFHFAWRDASIRQEEGRFVAALTTKAAVRPLLLLLRPRYYSQHLGYRGFAPWKRRGNEKPVAGWCSWEAFHDAVTQVDLERTAKRLAPLRDYGLEYLQLDDGFESPLLPQGAHDSVTDAWTRTNEKFPQGHEAIVRAIEAEGFSPGLWVCPNITNRAAAEEGGYCLKGPEGALYGDWIRGVIDCLPETLERQVTPCFRRLRELGYRYIKIDGMRHLTYDGMQEAVRRGLLNGEEAFDRVKQYVAAARAGLGEDAYVLSCWGVITPAVGQVDGMRVSTDAYPKWCAFSMQLYDTARWFFAQRILFTIDPDHVCVRAPLQWARMLLSLVSLSGGLYMISDPPECYDPERMALLRKTLPPTAVRTGETGPVDLTTPTCARGFPGYDDERLAHHITYIDPGTPSPFSSLWAFHFDQGERRWCVAQRCAIVPLPALEAPLESLGLDPDKPYFAYDFWKECPLGEVRGSLSFSALGLGDTSVIALCDISLGLPCLVASDRHVSMDAVSVESAQWRQGMYELTLVGWAGLEVKYTLYNAGRPLFIFSAADAQARQETEGSVTYLWVRFQGNRAAVSLKWEETTTE